MNQQKIIFFDTKTKKPPIPHPNASGDGFLINHNGFVYELIEQPEVNFCALVWREDVSWTLEKEFF